MGEHETKIIELAFVATKDRLPVAKAHWLRRYPNAYVKPELFGYSIRVDIGYYNYCVEKGLYNGYMGRGN